MKHEKDQGIIAITIFLMLLFFGTARLLLALPMEMEKSGDLSASAGADARARVREGDEVASGDGAVQTSQETTLAVSENDVDNHGVTLEHFQNALASNSDARRFVIAEDGSIQPREEISGAAEKNRSENLTIAEALRMALQSEHPTELVEELLPRPNTLINPGAPLSAAKLKEIFKILEELNSFDRLEATERTERWSEASSRESFSTKPPLSLDFSNHSPIFADSAYLQEKETVGKTLQELIAASHQETDRDRYYVEADQIWAQAQATWESRTAAQWEAKAKTKALTHANERLERAKEIFDNTKLDETALGRIASLAGRGAQVSAAIPVPHAQGVSAILGTVSTITENVNYFWTHADVDASELLQRLAARAVDSAQEALRKANEAAPGIDQLAQHVEEEARLREASARKADLELLQPPVTSFHETDWNDWATRVIQAGRGDPSTIPFLADHGMTDPVWAAEIVKTVGQTKALSEPQAHEAEKQKHLEPFEKAFQETSAIFEKAREATIQAEKEVTTAQERLVAATQFHAHWKSELEEHNASLNELEKPANARKPGNDQAIKIQKAKFSLAWKNFQQASSDLKTCEEFLSSAQATLATEEAKMLPLRNAATTAEEILLRNRERASLSNLDSKSLEQTPIVLRLPRLDEEGALTAQDLAIRVTQPAQIEPPIILEKAYATIGRASLKAQRGEPNFESVLFSKLAATDAVPLLPEIKEPTAEDLARWEAAENAEDFLDERDEVVATIKSRCAATASSSASTSSSSAAVQEASPTKKAASSSGLAAISEESEEISRDSEETPNLPISFASPRILKQTGSRTTSSGTSSTTVKTKSDRSESSLGTLVTWKTGTSRASAAQTIPESIASTASRSELKGLRRTMKALTESAERWAALVRKADAARVAAGGLPYPDEETLFDAWQKADVIAQAVWKKRCALQEEAARTAALHKQWEANTQRWEARAEADRMLHDQEQAELDLVSLAEQAKPLDPIWQARHQAALENLETTKVQAKEAQNKWIKLAAKEVSPINHNLLIDDLVGTDPFCLAQLEKRDQAVNALWERVRTDYYEEKDYETRRAQKARLAQKTGTYKFDLITEKNSAVAAVFAEADAALAQGRYAEAGTLEKAAMAHYAEATMQEALKVAWEQTPGAAEAWEFRAAKARRDEQMAFKAIEGDASRTAIRLAAIAQADQQALTAFQHEAKEFAGIEAAWRTQLAAEEKNSFLKKIIAAKNYLLGDHSVWHALSHQEREAHNEAVSATNELLLDGADRKLQEAKKNVWDLHQEAKKVWGVFKSKKSVEQIAQQAKETLARIKAEEDERKVGIQWAKLHIWGQPSNFDKKTLAHLQQPESNFVEIRWLTPNVWNEAKAFCDDVEISWARKADVVQAGYRLAAEYAKRLQGAWHQLAETKRAKLEQVVQSFPFSKGHPEAMATAMAVTTDLIKAEEVKDTWSKKITLAEKNALASLEPHVLKAKGAFEEARNLWEELHHHENADHVAALADKIKAQAATLTESDFHINEQALAALIALSSSAESLADLSIATRTHTRMRAGAGSVGVASTGAFIGGTSFGAFAVASTSAATALGIGLSGGIAAIPIVVGGAAYYGYRYYKKRNPTATILSPLAPRTTEATRTTLARAQAATEAAAHASADTIWAGDIEWCHEAIRRAHEFVTAITGSPALDEELVETAISAR